MDFEDYRRHDAVGLAELVARREVSPAELLDAAAARMADPMRVRSTNANISAATTRQMPRTAMR